MPSPWHYRAMVEAGTDECNVNKDCPAGKFCDVHTCRACLHERAACHFIGKEILVEDDFTLFPTKEIVFFSLRNLLWGIRLSIWPMHQGRRARGAWYVLRQDFGLSRQRIVLYPGDFRQSTHVHVQANVRWVWVVWPNQFVPPCIHRWYGGTRLRTL